MLGEFICDNKDLFCSKTVLELGAGTGICGIIAAKLGAKVLISDLDQKQVLNLIQTNLKLNNVEADVIPLQWGRLDYLQSIPKLDYIIGSDLFYEESDYEDLFFTLSVLLEGDITFYTAYHHRYSINIECQLKKWSLTSKFILYNSISDIHLYKINKAPHC